MSDLPKNYDPAQIEPEADRVWTAENLFHADPSDPGEPYCIVIPPPNVTGALHLGHAINTTLQDVLIRHHRMRGFNTLWIPGIDHAGIATQAVVEKQLKEKENKTRHDVGREGLVERIWAWKQQYGDRILSQLKRLGSSCDWSRTRFTLDDMCARAVRETFFKLFKDGLIYRGKRLVNWDTFLQTSISDDEIYHETVKTNLWHIRYPFVEDDAASRGTGAPPVNQEHGRGAHATYMVVATTRPETLLGDTAVAVHSQDPRWNWAIGKHVRLPLTDRLIPIIADDILVDPKFGTGVVKVTPAHDPNDYAVWQRHKGQADEIDLINILLPDGRLADDPRWQKYAGMKRDAARTKVVEDLKAAGLLEKEEPYETQVGHSDRSKTPIEPYLSDQWFVKMAPLAEPALEVVREGIIKFFPARFANTYLDWLGEKRDWPISRQLWWGHRIPVWRISFDPNNRFLRMFTSSGLNRPTSTGIIAAGVRKLFLALEDENGNPVAVVDPSVKLGTTRQERVAGNLEEEPPFVLFCSRSAQADATFQQLQDELERKRLGKPVASKFGELVEYITGVEQDPDVLDTWFSSALWPHSTLGWPEQTAELNKWYPTSVLVTSRDIITLWVARMVMTGIYNMGGGQFLAENAEEARSTIANRKLQIVNSIPFRDVHIHPTILDGKGERMSKTKGNGVDPVDVISTHGADALRFTLTQMATETQDAKMRVQLVCPNCGNQFDNPEGKSPTVNCTKCKRPMTRPMGTATGTPEAPLARGTSDRFDVGKHFCNKIWQVTQHFAMANLEKIAPESVDQSKWGLADRWIISRFARTLEAANTAIATYRFDQYAKACYDFFWGDFCDWYVEAIKPALKDPSRAGQTANVLAAMIDGALRLMHPMIPFITEVLFWRLNELRPERSLNGAVKLPAGPRLIKAAWPIADVPGDESESEFARLKEVIVAIRNLRTQAGIKPSQSVTVWIGAPEPVLGTINQNRELIELLATCAIKDVRAQISAVPNSTHVTAAGCDLYVEGLVDPEAEKQLRAKKQADLERQIAAMKGRLANEAYIAKAPPKLVDETRNQLATAEAELRKLRGE